ncbi:MAG: hypothetical protein AAGC68_06315 [Verrucomicrobiota bacterium]
MKILLNKFTVGLAAVLFIAAATTDAYSQSKRDLRKAGGNYNTTLAGSYTGSVSAINPQADDITGDLAGTPLTLKIPKKGTGTTRGNVNIANLVFPDYTLQITRVRGKKKKLTYTGMMTLTEAANEVTTTGTVRITIRQRGKSQRKLKANLPLAGTADIGNQVPAQAGDVYPLTINATATAEKGKR